MLEQVLYRLECLFVNIFTVYFFNFCHVFESMLPALLWQNRFDQSNDVA